MNAITVGTIGKEAARLDLLRLIDTRLLVQAASGGGKSYFLRKLIEMASPHVQVIVSDPEGEFGTLRERHDFLLIGKEGELQAEVRAASLLARRLAELKISAVMDLYDLKLPERRAFMSRFLNALMDLPRTAWHDILIVIDEAHIFAPERGHAAAESLEAVVRLMTQGRKRGFCPVLATQRLSALSKDAAAQAGNLLIGLTALDTDLKRAGDVLGMGTRERTQLIHIERGSFFAFGPAWLHDGVQKVAIGRVKTTHPQAGQLRKLVMPAPSKAIQGVLSEFADLPEQAEQEIRDMEQANAKIMQLGQQVRSLEQQLTEGGAAPAGEIDRLRGELAAAREAQQRQRGECDAIITRMVDYTSDVVQRVQQAVACLQLPPVPDATIPETRTVPARTISHASAIATVEAARSSNGQGRSALRERILDAVAWWNSAGVSAPTRDQVAFVARARPRSGHFGNTLSKLHTGGSIEYPEAGRIGLTDDGRKDARFPARSPTRVELLMRVREKLGNGLPRMIFDVLVARGELNKVELAEAVDRSATSGHFGNTLSKMHTGGVIRYPRAGAVALSEAFEAVA